MPQYVFCVFGSAEGRSAWLHSLEAYDKNTGQRVAELPYPKEFAEGLGLVERSLLQGQPKFEDFNFDGYMDVSLLSFVGATGNSGANVWIYDSGSGEFVYERLLSQRKLKVHPERQEITSSWNGGHAGMIYGRDTIRWVDGEAAVVRSESQRWDGERQCYDFSLKVWREGGLVETVRECSVIGRPRDR